MGACVTDFLHAVSDVIASVEKFVEPALNNPANSSVIMVPEDAFLTQIERALSIRREQSQRMMGGLVLDAAKVHKQTERIDTPNREYRMPQRNILRIHHGGESQLLVAPDLIRSAIHQFRARLVSNDCPPEWQPSKIATPLRRLTTGSSAWFEEHVRTVMRKQAVCGVHSFERTIGRSSRHVAIPKNIGQIDGMGIVPAQRLIVVAEIKRLRRVHNSFTLGRDTWAFAHPSRDNYLVKFRRKLGFVAMNFQLVKDCLAGLPDFAGAKECNAIAPIFITLWPTPLTYFNGDIPVRVAY